MSQPKYLLDEPRRVVVLESTISQCAHRRWHLWAAHIRENHVHVVVTAQEPPERLLNVFKSYASRALNQAGFDDPKRRRWSRHGSTQYIWKPEQIERAVHYVLHQQGNTMQTYSYEPR